ncbi:MAG: cytochrome P450 [Solirubrobacteraceae bacterium]
MAEQLITEGAQTARSQGCEQQAMPGLPPASWWPSVAQSAAVLWFTERYARWGVRHFDSPRTYRLLGLGEYVAVWDPQQIKELFMADRDLVRAGEANARVLAHVAPSSLLVLDGERHVRMRRVMSPPFHGEAVRQYGELIGDLAAAEVQRWPVGEAFAIHRRMQAIALEVILRAVIGVRDPARMARLRSLLPRVAQASILAYIAETNHPRVAEGRLGARLPWLRARREAELLLYEEIAAHRADPDGRQDVLALLIAARDENDEPLSDAELRDQLFTLLIAGQETTATALAWCFERLLRHPDALAFVQEQLDSDAHLDAVINETLRVRPPLDGAARKLSGPVQIGGYLLPAGTIVIASIIGAHLSDTFPHPEQFRPERFLNQPPAPYALIPFGGGPRRCIGAGFALMEMRIILRTVLQHVQLRAPTQRPERPVRTRRLTTYPARGGRVIVTTRRHTPDPQADS